jgi:hypothetical protein
MARQRLIHLHSTSKSGSLAALTGATMQVGELATYNPSSVADVTIYALNSGATAVAEFKSNTYYDNKFKDYSTTSQMNNAITSAKTELIGTTGSTSGTTTVYGAKKYADDLIATLDSTATTTEHFIRQITFANGKVDKVTGGTIALAKTAGAGSDTYQLKVNGNIVGDTITVYKDSSLSNVYLSGQTMHFDYILANGSSTTITVDLSDFINETEVAGMAGSGLTASGTVLNIVKATESEDFLTVGTNSIAIKGVQNAINTAKNAVIGNSSDTSGTTTVYGAKKYTDDKITALDASGKSYTDNRVISKVTGGSGSFVTVTPTLSGLNSSGRTLSFEVKDGPIQQAISSAVTDMATQNWVNSNYLTKTGASSTYATITNLNKVSGAVTSVAITNGTYVQANSQLISSNKLTFTINDSAIGTALNGKLANSHESVSATTTTIGHVKISNGDVNTVAHADGLVAGMDHTHSNYVTANHSHGTLKLQGDVTGSATIDSGGTTINTTVSGLTNKLSSFTVTYKKGNDNGKVSSATVTATTAATSIDLSLLSIDCGEY